MPVGSFNCFWTVTSALFKLSLVNGTRDACNDISPERSLAAMSAAVGHGAGGDRSDGTSGARAGTD